MSLFPNADPEVLNWVVKTELDVSAFLMALYFQDKQYILESTSRAEGGLIPDPRLVKTVDPDQAIEQITAKIEGLVDARAIRLADLKLPHYQPHPDGRVKGKARLFDLLKDPRHGLRRLKLVGIQALVDLVPLINSSLEVFSAFVLRYYNTGGFEALLKILYPPRSKQDMNIRRTRFRDLFLYYISQGVTQLTILWDMMGQDYIRTLITCWFCQGLNKNIFPLLTQTTIPQLDDSTNELTNLLKSNPAKLGWQIFAELKNLTGYRFLPWEGFDAKADTIEFATGGALHDMYHSFTHWLKDAIGPLNSKSSSFKPLTFLQFITSNHWITAGASTEGKIVIIYDGKQHKVKCRKNVVKDVIEISALHKAAIDSTQQIAHAFAKYETGKIRIAVTGDLLSYLKMAWLAYLAEYSYKRWPETTRQEDGLARTTRMLAIIDACKAGVFGLAWDFKGFERQVQTAESKIIQSQVNDQAIANYPSSADVAQNVMDTFDNSTLIGMDGTAYQITGGLPSGILGTSYIGDGFNLAASQAAIKLLVALGGTKAQSRLIQGDDASYMDQNPHILQMIDWLLTRMGFVAGDGKFGIVGGSTEFLRVSYDKDGAHGYPARSIVGLVQRKPWSDAPTSDTLPIASAIDALFTSTNRGLSLPHAPNLLRSFWSRLHGISDKIAASPQPNGLGIGPPIPNIRYDGKMQKPLILKSLSLTPYRHEYWQNLADTVSLKLDHLQIESLVQRDLQSMLITDNVPGTSAYLRDVTLAHLKTVKTFVQLPPLQPILNTILLAKDIAIMAQAIRPQTNPDYGAYEHDEAALQKYSPLAQFGLSLTALRAKKFPLYAAAISIYRRQGLTHTDAVNFLSAQLPTNTGIFNKSITTYLQAAIANQLIIASVPSSRLTDIWLTINNLVLIDCQTSKLLRELHTW